MFLTRALRPALRARANTPLRAEAEAAGSATGASDKIKLNFNMPHLALYSAEPVDSVIVPAATGVMGVHPNHVPTIAELKPGVVTVEKEDAEPKHFFVSSGFAVVHADSSMTVSVVEAVGIDEIDADKARAGLEEYTARAAAVKEENLEKAYAEIGLEVHQALVHAVETHK